MTFNDSEIREIATLSESRNMPMPQGAPAWAVQHICEKRAKLFGYTPSAAPVPRSENEPADLRVRLTAVSLF